MDKPSMSLHHETFTPDTSHFELVPFLDQIVENSTTREDIRYQLVDRTLGEVLVLATAKSSGSLFTVRPSLECTHRVAEVRFVASPGVGRDAVVRHAAS